MKLFVYGTLKSGEFNHDRYNFNKTAVFLGAATAPGVEIMQVAGYPYPHAQLGTEVPAQGELYELDLNEPKALTTFLNLLRMEEQAGYSLQWTDVIDEHGRVETVMVFVAYGWKLTGLHRLGFTKLQSWTGVEPIAA